MTIKTSRLHMSLIQNHTKSCRSSTNSSKWLTPTSCTMRTTGQWSNSAFKRDNPKLTSQVFLHLLLVNNNQLLVFIRIHQRRMPKISCLRALSYNLQNFLFKRIALCNRVNNSSSKKPQSQVKVNNSNRRHSLLLNRS